MPKIQVFDGIKWIEIAKNGKDGNSPDENKIIQEVLKKIPAPKNGKDAVPVDIEKLTDKILKELLSSQQWKDMEKKVLYNKFDQRWHGGGSGQVVLIADLTDQCDGIKTTFTIPAFSRALKLESTQFPIIYRPTTDWTASGTTLSLGAGVGAPETGQTLLFYYVA